jgi:hypothetical protein
VSHTSNWIWPKFCAIVSVGPPRIPNNRVGVGATYGAEAERVNLDTEGGHVLLLEFTSQMALDEGGLAKTSSVSKRSTTPQSAHERWIRVPGDGSSELTLPVPPSPTRTSLKVGIPEAASAMVVCWMSINVKKERGLGSPS